MAANKFTFKLDNSDKSLQVGLQMVHDDAGRADLIHEYEEHKVRELLQPNKDFEVTRYRHAPWEGDSNNASDPSPPIEYSFIFNDPNTGGWPSLPLFPPVVGATQFGYNLQGFNNLDISIRKESFLRSFFKLDLYQTPDRAKQKLYISKIIDTISGNKLITVEFIV